MHIYSLDKRQQPPSAGSGSSNNSGLPAALWILVVICIGLAVTCGVCARRNRHRQFLYRQSIINSRRPTGSEYAPPWAAFSRASADPPGLRPPPRARRRGSRASVTSLPVYMENPGAQEIVLLQRATQKDAVTPSQPISVSSAPISPSAPATVGSNPPLPGHLPSAVASPSALSPPGSHSPAAPQLTDTSPRS